MATLITKNSSTASAVPAAGDLVKGELAVNVTDKKVYTKDNSAAVVKLVGSLGNQEANAVAITGGAINGTTIGATTPSTGAFTTASASSGFTGNLTGNVTGNVSGTAANVTGVVAIANGGTGLSSLGTGVQSALGQAVTGSGSFVLSTSPSLTTPNLGTPSAAVLTNATGLPLTTGVTGTLGVANGGTGITAFGTGVATALGQNVTGSGGIVLATSPSLTTPNLGTPSAATLTNATGLPISTGVSGLGTNVATALAVNVGTAGAFVVNGGALGTPSGGTLTNCTGYPTSALSGSINLATQVTGTLATTNGGTGLTSFTANGVVYASSSSALTTGSALSFDGTNFATTGSGTVKNLLLTAGTLPGAGNPSISLRSADNVVYHQSGSANTIVMLDSAQNTMQNIGATAQIWNISNAEQMRLTSTGLGIGTSSPTFRLDALSSGSTQVARFRTGGTSTSDVVSFERSDSAVKAVINYNGTDGCMSYGTTTNHPIGFWTNNTERMRLDSSGNLGLGVTPSGTWKFEVKTGSQYVASIYQSGSVSHGNKTAVLGFYDGTYYNTAGYWAHSHYWNVNGGGTQAMTLDASGNLLVGKTSGSGARLEVSGSASGAYISNLVENINAGGYASTNYSVGASGASGTASINYAPGIFFAIGPTSNDTTTPIVFRNNNATERARIDANGNLLVGTTSATTVNSASPKLVVFSNAGDNIIAKNSTQELAVGCDYVSANTNNALRFATNNTERARITSGGNLLVGKTTTGIANTGIELSNLGWGQFTVSGDASLFTNRLGSDGDTVKFYRDTSFVGSISVTASATAYNTSSDYRLKDNPQPLTGSGAFIDALQPKTWDWKSGGKGVGFIAHEVQEVSPGSVVGTKDAVDEEGKPIMQAMEYGSAEFIANIIAELQSLRARVAQLEAK